MSVDANQVKSRPIPTRVLTLKDWSQLPDCYSQTPGGTLFSTTPGGKKNCTVLWFCVINLCFQNSTGKKKGKTLEKFDFCWKLMVCAYVQTVTRHLSREAARNISFP